MGPFPLAKSLVRRTNTDGALRVVTTTRGFDTRTAHHIGLDPLAGAKRYVSHTASGGKRRTHTELARFVVAEAPTLAPAPVHTRAEKHRTLSELVEQHIARHEGSPTTLLGYRAILEMHICRTSAGYP